MMVEKRMGVKQVVVLSGKGGTGKTSVSAGLVHLASKESQIVYVDADVDAANLALVTEAKILITNAFWGSQRASIQPALCNRCGICFDTCRFTAIKPPKEGETSYAIIDFLCEGCEACVNQCPQDAIEMVQQQDGEWYRSDSPYGRFVHAELFPGAENTGKLVTMVKQQARLLAEDHQLPLMIVDGPPGIGCPVISASAGADLAILIAEPGMSGLHDLERIIQTLDHFEVPMLIVVNKADIYPKGVEEIKKLAKDNGCMIGDDIPFDDAIPKAMVNAQPVTRMFPDSPASKAIGSICNQMHQILFQESGA
jgi:MinD superfamily P-loop ATPase